MESYGNWKDAGGSFKDDVLRRVGFNAANAWTGTTSTNGNHVHTVSVGNTGSGQTHTHPLTANVSISGVTNEPPFTHWPIFCDCRSN